MKKFAALIPLLFLFALTPFGPSQAMKLKGESLSSSPVYKPTKSAVMKAMKKMGYDYTIDKDGDLKFKIKKKNWKAFVIFNELSSSGRLWNLQLFIQFATKKSRYEELLEYVNKWNAKKKYPKLSMVDEDSLRATINYPVQYGFNPDEFEENVMGMFITTVKQIGEETYAMRR